MASGNISKIAINNEVVLMRQSVRKSRVAVVRKLIKEAKLLQARKHGDEKVQEKCKRKAMRLLAEISAIKKLKDDEISKFGITNTSKLQEVLNDTSVEPATRVMTRLAFHKILSDRIIKFKEKFPEYEQHLGPGRKKMSKIERQTKREARNALRKSDIPGENNETIANPIEDSENKIEDDNSDEESDVSSNEEIEDTNDSEGDIEPSVEIESSVEIEPLVEFEENLDQQLDSSIAEEHGFEPGSILRIKTPNKATKKRKIVENLDETEASVSKETVKEKKDEKKKTKSIIPLENTSLGVESSDEPKPKLKKNKEEKKIVTKTVVLPKKIRSIKIVSKEATVKRFTDIIDDKDAEERIEAADISSSTKKQDLKIEKEVDSFFMTENGESEYLSVVVPRPLITENPEEDDRFSQNNHAARRQNFHERNNKFFSKIDQRANGGYNDQFDGRQRQNNFNNTRCPPEKFGRNVNNARNVKTQFEKKIEPKDETLHPSWAARKKQQEILKQGFQGKKIVFDD